jgi:hypothetical protein
MVMAAPSQTITDRIKCQRRASICPINDISSGSGSFLFRSRLKNCFLSDASVAKMIKFAHPVEIVSDGDSKGKVLMLYSNSCN